MDGGLRTPRRRVPRGRSIALGCAIVAMAAPWNGSASSTVAAEPRVVQGEQAQFCLSGTSPSRLSTMFDGEPAGLVGADYQRAVALPDGRTLWLFQDGAVRTGPGAITVVHNVAMLQDDRCFSVLYGGTRQSPRSFLFADETIRFERWFWPLDAEMGDDGLLYVFVAEMVERGDDYLTRVDPVGTRVAAFDPSSDAIVATGLPGNASDDLYGWSITSDHRWTYLYGQCYRQFGYDLYIFTLAFDRSCSTRVTVGRVPRGRPLEIPQYWDGTRWQPDPVRAASVIPTDGRRINANQIEFAGSSFFSVNKEGDWWGDTIYFSRAEHPAGPFVVYDQIPAVVKCAVCNSFFATWIPRTAAEHPPSSFVVGLSHNRWDGVISSLYRPTFHAVPAPPLLGGGGTLPIVVDGGGDAVIANVTSTRSEDRGHLTAYPCDAQRPVASVLNHPAGGTTGNLVVVRPDADGRVCVYTRATTDLVVDAFGAFDADDGFVAQPSPTRIVDTRATGPVPAGGVLRVPIPGGLRSAVFTVTSVTPDSDGFVSAFPCDRQRPLAANLNHRVGEVVGNLAMVRVGGTGEVCLYAKTATDLVVDLAGGFVPDAGFAAEDVPRRLYDTRDDGGRIVAGDVLRVPVPDGSGAVVVNLAAVDAVAAGYATAYDCDGQRPAVSSLNYAAGSVRSNLAVVAVGASREICVFTLSTTHLVVDLAGTFPVGGFVPTGDPIRLVDTRVGLGS